MAVEVGDVGAALDEASELADDQATFASGRVFRFEAEKEVLIAGFAVHVRVEDACSVPFGTAKEYDVKEDDVEMIDASGDVNCRVSGMDKL